MTYNPIFVFGSNLSGIHGAGAAKYAYENCGAEWGVGEGLTGNSYALPTKDENIETRTLWDISRSALTFVSFAEANPEMVFYLTPIATGLAGYLKEDIWEMFQGIGIPSNVYLTSTWMTE